MGQTVEELEAYADELNGAQRTLTEKYPELPFVTLVVMAQDMVAMKHARERIDAGADPTREMHLVGSYARFGFAVDLMEEGLIPRDRFFEEMAELWRGADPDDGDPRFLTLWKAAWRRNKFRPVRDEPGGKRIPRGGQLDVFRGQRMFEKAGIAWSLERSVAETFARGASFRTPIKDGILIHASVPASKVLAYITGRGEHEVIIDPDEILWMSELPMREVES